MILFGVTKYLITGLYLQKKCIKFVLYNARVLQLLKEKSIKYFFKPKLSSFSGNTDNPYVVL